MATIPREISRSTHNAAMRAFMEVIGVDPFVVCSPVVMTGEAVMFPACPLRIDDEPGKPLRRTSPGELFLADPQDDEWSELTVMVTIKVVD